MSGLTDASGETWQAPDMEKRQFRSWDAFFIYMDEYQQRTNQVFTRRTATSVKTRNHVLAAIAVSGRPLPSPLLPESFLDYTRMLQCAHKSNDEAARTQVRWNGVQPSECQAKVNATLQRCADGQYRICVTNLNLAHNHPLGAGAVRIPAPVRPAVPAPSPAPRLPLTDGMQGATKRRRVGRPRKYPLSSETTQPTVHAPSMKDVRQFLERVERVRARQPGLVQSVEERLASYVNEFAAQDGNVAKIFVDDQKVLSSITLQTKHMRKVFEAFPEVLRVDDMSSKASGSSGSSYRVFSLMAHDTFGNWQYVQHAIVENGHSETLRAALNQFKAHNQRHNRIRAIIVRDGDSPVLPELLECFPTARILYSQFHVLRVLHDAIATHGKDLSSWHRDRLAGITQMLVYAPISGEYAANLSKMGDVLGVHHPFFRHFLEKWDSCRDRWTTFAREGVTTFSITTGGNQFAPTWKFIFDAANDEFALDETVAAIRYYQAVVERAFVSDIHRAVTNADSTTIWRGNNNNDEYDAEMRLLAATVGPAASNLIFPQYHHAATRARYQFCEPTRGSFFISAVTVNDAFNDEATKEFCVEAERGWQCSCAFMVNHHLPCRHVFYIRRIVRCSCVIPMEFIEPRWVLEKALRFFDAPQVGGSARGILREAWLESEAESDFERRNVISEPGAWQKFVTGLEVGKRIGKRMMEMGPAEFDHALRFYKLVETTMNARPFDVNSRAIAAQISNHATQSAALAGVVSRLNTAAHAMNTSTPHATAPGAAGTMYVSANDKLAAAARTKNMSQPGLNKAPVSVPSTSKSREVIDLAEDGESEEEKEENSEQNGRIAGTGSATSKEKEKEPVEVEGGRTAKHASNGDNQQERASEDAERSTENEDVASETRGKAAEHEEYEYDEGEYDEDYEEEAGGYDEDVEEGPSGRLEGKV